MKCTVFRVNVPYFFTSVPEKVDRMLAGLHIHLMSLAFYQILCITKHDNVVPLDIFWTISLLYPFNFELHAMSMCPGG